MGRVSGARKTARRKDLEHLTKIKQVRPLLPDEQRRYEFLLSLYKRGKL